MVSLLNIEKEPRKMTTMIFEELKRQFTNDLLYIFLQREGFIEADLFPEFINQISMDRVYSTLEVAEMFKISDNNLRYQMKMMRKLGYINSIKAGRNYRFNYLNIYRMYLVTLILNMKGRNTGDIENILNGEDVSSLNKEITPVTDESKKDDSQSIWSFNHLVIQMIEKQIAINELQTCLNESTRKYMQLDQRFNSMLVEIQLMNKLNESIKQPNKKWFYKHNEIDSSATNLDDKQQLTEYKDQLATILFNINDYEKRLTINLYELKQLYEEK